MPYISITRRLSSLAAVCVLAAAATASHATAADQPERIAWRLEPSAHYAVDVHMTHVIANDLGGIYKKLAGSKADPVTILEDRTIDVSSAADGTVDAATVDVRHYGGLQAKDTSVMRRTTEYKGAIAATGRRSPSDEPLVDAGDGPLDEFPDQPLAVGQTWSLTRSILVDRELGHGSMTYTDTLTRIDVRGTHKIAVIAVKGAGKADVASDLKAKGFATADITLAGTAEFDITDGVPGVQHYTAHAQWNTHVLWVHLGLVFDDTYDAAPWTRAAH
jgi:hypothetical protein